MEQVRRQHRNPSPPPRQIPPLPNAIRFRPPSSTNVRRTQTFQVNDRPPYPGSPVRAIHPQQFVNHPPPRFAQTPPQTGVFYNSTNTKYDPLTGLILNSSTNNNNENYEQSYIISSSFNQLTSHERQPPPAPPPSSENVYPFYQQQHERSTFNTNRIQVCVI
jgi:hypothetical protein